VEGKGKGEGVDECGHTEGYEGVPVDREIVPGVAVVVFRLSSSFLLLFRHAGCSRSHSLAFSSVLEGWGWVVGCSGVMVKLVVMAVMIAYIALILYLYGLVA
jgi:hypothetical protein